MNKRIYQPNNRRRAKVYGFRKRTFTRTGRAALVSWRRKGRARLVARGARRGASTSAG